MASGPRPNAAGGRVVSVQTTNERGGAEYANVDLLDALAARGHDVVLLTNVPDLAAGTRVRVREVDLGPKLASRTAAKVILAAPLTLLALARALRAERPVAVTLLHFKKEQLLCSLLPRRLTGRIVWAEWGHVPAAMRRGLPRLVYALAARRAAGIMAVSQGTKDSVAQAGVPAAKIEVIPNLVDVDGVTRDEDARRTLRQRVGRGRADARRRLHLALPAPQAQRRRNRRDGAPRRRRAAGARRGGRRGAGAALARRAV